MSRGSLAPKNRRSVTAKSSTIAQAAVGPLVALDALLTPRQFAARCGVTTKTAIRWCKAGKLAGAFITPGGVCWKIPESSLPKERQAAAETMSMRDWNRRADEAMAKLEARSRRTKPSPQSTRTK
ncbi:helix-turn-helix domain-containing protein [Limnoglobus roseus]|uniref:Helix-turn-helix domain-containing protein n=1 Tax=Limnoglobus roseus TaxID=2598579 RepID=A0A5C1ABX1_9BACT|nr:helix-turn-helix domain-containing protein [Limnoglobus roseus]QEL14644.1 hypothetical protein PX52LOC_01537 [Limnoglobus roseus]